ncbi:hypothetical protein MMC28_006957, partial [Mycoblastus sanguinarius]|nr:hypothetical protein [Mycoblastus sanguinarius]
MLSHLVDDHQKSPFSLLAEFESLLPPRPPKVIPPKVTKRKTKAKSTRQERVRRTMPQLLERDPISLNPSTRGLRYSRHLASAPAPVRPSPSQSPAVGLMPATMITQPSISLGPPLPLFAASQPYVENSFAPLSRAIDPHFVSDYRPERQDMVSDPLQQWYGSNPHQTPPVMSAYERQEQPVEQYPAFQGPGGAYQGYGSNTHQNPPVMSAYGRQEQPLEQYPAFQGPGGAYQWYPALMGSSNSGAQTQSYYERSLESYHREQNLYRYPRATYNQPMNAFSPIPVGPQIRSAYRQEPNPYAGFVPSLPAATLPTESPSSLLSLGKNQFSSPTSLQMWSTNDLGLGERGHGIKDSKIGAPQVVTLKTCHGLRTLINVVAECEYCFLALNEMSLGLREYWGYLSAVATMMENKDEKPATGRSVLALEVVKIESR